MAEGLKQEPEVPATKPDLSSIPELQLGNSGSCQADSSNQHTPRLLSAHTYPVLHPKMKADLGI